MKHNIENINRLLDLYWEGETSIAQEAELRAYFNGDDVATDHAAYTSMFVHFSKQRALTTDLDVEQVLASIAEPKTSIFRLFSVKRYSMGIAAALTLMLSVTTVMNLQTTKSNVVVLDEAHETEEALRVTKEALALLSSKLDQSTKKVNDGISKMKSASIIR